MVEFGFVLGAALLLSLGMAAVNLADGEGTWTDATTGFLVVSASFGLVLLAMRARAPTASSLLIPAACLPVAMGLLIIYRLDADLARMHLGWLMIGSLVAAARLYYHGSGVDLVASDHTRSFLIAGVGALLVLPTVRGAGQTVWIGWGSEPEILVHSGEIVKLLMVVLLAAWIANLRRGQPSGQITIGSVVSVRSDTAWILVLMVGVLVRSPGIGLFIIGVGLIMAYLATARTAFLFWGLGAGLGVMAVRFGFTSSGRDLLADRLAMWLGAEAADERWVQGLFGLGAGGLFGTGLGLGYPDLIPGASTDQVLAAIGEELGLAGVVALLGCYGLLVFVGFGIARTSPRLSYKLMAAGVSLLLGLHVVLSAGGVSGLVPGVTLPVPLVSYGLTMTLAGFLVVAELARISSSERA